jgi:hypothetical protein
MAAFLLFALWAGCLHPVEDLRASFIGQWIIQACEFNRSDAYHVNFSYYAIDVKETSDAHTLQGQLFSRNDTALIEPLTHVQVAFEAGNDLHVQVFTGETFDFVELADVYFSVSETRGFKTAVGVSTGSALWYSLSVHSYKAFELVVINENDEKVTIYRWFKEVNDNSSGSSSFFMQIFPLLFIGGMVFGLGRRSNQPDTAPEAEQKNEKGEARFSAEGSAPEKDRGGEPKMDDASK